MRDSYAEVCRALGGWLVRASLQHVAKSSRHIANPMSKRGHVVITRCRDGKAIELLAGARERSMK
jgi:hypothetical protein